MGDNAEKKPQIFTYAQVSSHNTAQDCWVIINAKVYDVTNYLSEHPGGDDVILGQAGKDASEEFEDVGHGSAARLMLDEFYMGELDPATSSEPINVMPLPPTCTTHMKTPLINDHKLVYFLLALTIIASAFGVQFIRFSS